MSPFTNRAQYFAGVAFIRDGNASQIRMDRGFFGTIQPQTDFPTPPTLTDPQGSYSDWARMAFSDAEEIRFYTRTRASVPRN